MTAYGTQVRDGVKRKCRRPARRRGLRHHHPVHVPPAYFGFYCVPIIFPNHTQCAAYQMLYFMRYTRKGPAPECPCYKYCCVHCSPPAAGAEEDKYQRVTRKVGKTLRGADHHAMEELSDKHHRRPGRGPVQKPEYEGRRGHHGAADLAATTGGAAFLLLPHKNTGRRPSPNSCFAEARPPSRGVDRPPRPQLRKNRNHTVIEIS